MISVVLAGGGDAHEGLRRFLVAAGMEVCVAADRAAVDEVIARGAADIAVVDASTDRESALALAAQLRLTTTLGIVLLGGARSERLTALSLGVDHCLGGHPDPREIEIRIRSLHWRLTGRRADAPSLPRPAAPAPSGAWRLGAAGWSLASPGGRSVPLSLAEHGILGALVRRPGTIVTRGELLIALRRDGASLTGRNLDAIVSRLRKKVERTCGERLPVRSARGVGYVFTGSCLVHGGTEPPA